MCCCHLVSARLPTWRRFRHHPVKNLQRQTFHEEGFVPLRSALKVNDDTDACACVCLGVSTKVARGQVEETGKTSSPLPPLGVICAVVVASFAPTSEDLRRE